MVNTFAPILHFAQTAAENIQNSYVPVEDLEDQITSLSANATWAAAISLIILVVIAALMKDKYPKLKLPLFIMIAFIMASSFLMLAGSTIYLNVKSDSGGPVHWHADIEFWACGNELELRDPYEFLSNKIGTATLHEHDDHRIHLEGVPVDLETDATLGKFMYVVGGAVTDDALVVPLNPPEVGGYFENDIDGDGSSDLYASQINPYIIQTEDGPAARFVSGETCGDQPSEVQVFRYHTNDDDTYYQEKIDNPRDYIMRDTSVVPDGDCIIFEFGPARDKTDKLCQQYGVVDQDRCESFGVTGSHGICTMREVPAPGYTEDTSGESASSPSDPLEPIIPQWPYDFDSLTDEQLTQVKSDCAEVSSNPDTDISEECAALNGYEADLGDDNQ